jgi:hypothetical protein
MNIESIVNDVVRLPQRFYGRGDVSIHALLKDSGYFDVYDEVTEEKIGEVLRRHPELTVDWIEYSAAKRASSGWFLRREGLEGLQVGHYPSDNPVEYSDEIAACAIFIKREIEEIRIDCEPA